MINQHEPFNRSSPHLVEPSDLQDSDKSGALIAKLVQISPRTMVSWYLKLYYNYNLYDNYSIHGWLVVLTILKNMLVNGKDYVSHIWNGK